MFSRIWLAVIALLASQVQAAEPAGKHLTRVFFQDDATKTVQWADLTRGTSLGLTTPQVVDGRDTAGVDGQ